MRPDDGDFTSRLQASAPWTDSTAMRSLFPLVYRELKAVARRQLGRAPGHSLDTTGLVHEAYFKLAKVHRERVQDRAHFLAISARAMRQVLVAAARKRHSLKHGAGIRPDTLTQARDETVIQLDDVLAINNALDKLEDLEPRLARLVECRFFAGLTVDETAEALERSTATVNRDWRRAKAWLRHYLRSEAADSASIDT